MKKNIVFGLVTAMVIVSTSLVTVKLYGMIRPMLRFTVLPGGPYTKSCHVTSLHIEGQGMDQKRVITAECQATDGTWKKTTITIPVCVVNARTDYTLSNENGELKAQEPQQLSAYRPLHDPLFSQGIPVNTLPSGN